MTLNTCVIILYNKKPLNIHTLILVERNTKNDLHFFKDINGSRLLIVLISYIIHTCMGKKDKDKEEISEKVTLKKK